MLLWQRSAKILGFFVLVAWPISYGSFRNSYSKGRKKNPKPMACWHSPPSLNELLFAKMSAWKSVVLPDLCVLHLELTDLAQALCRGCVCTSSHRNTRIK